MKKTLRLRQIPMVSGQRGRVLVATSFIDPDRGMVRCHAAPLLAELLAREHTGSATGLRFELGPAPEEVSTDSCGSDAVMVTASYVDRRGIPAGLALVAHRADGAAVMLAQTAAARWMTVLRSRRLLVADAGPLCWGGQRAVRMIEDSVRARPGSTFVIGLPVNGPAAWERAGVVCTDDVSAVPDGAHVVFPAHGVTPAMREQAAARGLHVTDATCPLVAAVHADAAHYAARGDRVVVVGNSRHASLPVLAAHADAAAVVVENTAHADALADSALHASIEKPGGAGISFVIDPGMAIEDAMPVLATLRARFPHLAGHHFDVLCEDASDRAQTIGSVACASELMLLITADRDDPDTQVALEATARARSRAGQVAGGGSLVQVLTRLADLEPGWLSDATTIGLAATPSAPPGLQQRIMSVLAGLGPLSVRRRSVHTYGIDVQDAAHGDHRAEDAPPAQPSSASEGTTGGMRLIGVR